MLTILLITNLVAIIALGIFVAFKFKENSDLKTKQEELVKQQQEFATMQQSLAKLQEAALERIERNTKDEFARSRDELANSSKANREELSKSIKDFSEYFSTHIRDLSGLQKGQLESFAKQLESFEKSSITQLNHLGENSKSDLGKMRETIQKQLQLLQEDNSSKLEKMRATVDEKLHATLEKRLGESFKFVSDRLEQVHKGLGEMQNLATGVGDLKKVLTNVKTRGTWGEIQLGSLLEQILSPEQYEKNVQVKRGSQERVDFVLKLPGQDDKPLLLSIDSKFPIEDYQKLVDAQDRGDVVAAAEALKQLEARVKLEGRTIRDKYISPPKTTDFGILFLPTEGLYAEVLRIPELAARLQADYRVIVAGPTTLAALLNSLQMGFRTLAIQKRSSEVWKILASVKSEFVKFGDILDKTHKKLQEASNNIETAARKSRNIEGKLNRVQELPVAEAVEPEKLLSTELN